MLVSAIIPTYNRAATIARSVDSVLQQTWKPVEVVVVDDGSTDQTTDVLARYGNQIRVIRQKNQGPGAARNAGIQAARGEIISFLDSDDTWLPNKTERQAKLLQVTESRGVVCCVCDARMEFQSGTRRSFAAASLHPRHAEGIWSNPSEILMNRFLLFNQVVAVRREALDQVGYFRTNLPHGSNEDYDLALRLSLVGPWAFIADPLVVWHEHADNRSRTHRQLEICLDVLEVFEHLSKSSQFGPLLPKRMLQRRIRHLRQSVTGLRLSAQSKPAARLWGTALVHYLSMREKLYRRLPSVPRMVTHTV
jgi:glycosyltransferase involved in cell wall biosynthesis